MKGITITVKKGFLICFTGIDGAGKSTQAKRLLSYLRERNVDAIYTWSRREPFLIKPLVCAIKKHILREEVKNNEGECYLEIKEERDKFFKHPLIRSIWLAVALIDYFIQLVPKVHIPVLKGKVVVCDRYIHDAIVDFAANFGYGRKKIRSLLKKPFLKLFPSPDKVFYIKISPEVGRSRKNDGTSLEYLSDRKVIYDILAKQLNMCIINGLEGVDSIGQKILQESRALVAKT